MVLTRLLRFGIYGSAVAAVLATAAVLLTLDLYYKKVVFTDWRYVVIHHTASKHGNLAGIDKYHRERGWHDGIGYHFIVGNGFGMGDGEVAATPRWQRGLAGHHVNLKAFWHNAFGIGIALVGNFEDEGKPTDAQWESLVALVTDLARRHKIPEQNVLAHRECPGTFVTFDGLPTLCPGKHLDIRRLRWSVRDRLRKKRVVAGG